MNNTNYIEKNKNLLLNTEYSWDVDPSIMGGEKNIIYNVSDVYKDRTFMVDKKLRSKINYTINNFGQRSSDFYRLDKTKTNVLYAGCSTTFGEFLPEGYSWQHHLHDFISSKTDVSSPATISFPGGSVQKIIDNIYKYIHSFGTPNYIFLLLPDLFRTNWPRPDGNGFSAIMRDQKVLEGSKDISEHSMIYACQAQYRSFEIFCKSLGIKLYTSSWDHEVNHIFSNLHFLNYGMIDFETEMDFVMNLDQDLLKGYDSDFLVSAGDKQHPGLLKNMFFANHFIERLKNE